MIKISSKTTPFVLLKKSNFNHPLPLVLFAIFTMYIHYKKSENKDIKPFNWNFEINSYKVIKDKIFIDLNINEKQK